MKNDTIIVRPSTPAISLQFLVKELPTFFRDRCILILEGTSTLLYQSDQVQCLQKISKDLYDLISKLPQSRSHSLPERQVLLNCDFFTVLGTVINNAHRGISRIHCPHCAAVDHFRIDNGLSPRHSLQRLRYSLAPQVLPQGLRSIGNELYKVGPYSINLDATTGQRVVIPVLNGISISDRRKIFETVMKIRAEEKKTASYTSIHLDRILQEREGLVKILAGKDDGIIKAAVYASVGLLGLYPLLLDDRIAEFFVDREGSFAYVDHRDLGRCLSSVFVQAHDMKRLITFARITSGKALDHSSPSLRVSLKTAGFHARISVDGPPLSLEGTSLSCRKFFTTPLTLKELESYGTLPASISSTLAQKIWERKNITIYGESGSGKTTLAIALDLLTPSTWRKFSVESDVAENVSQSPMGLHQVRLLSAGTTPEEQAKRTHILNSLLHKSPDYIFLGEVLSKEDSASLFQILAAGLKCIHTVHAETAEGLLRRWVFQHGVSPSSLHCLDILVQMVKCAEAGAIIRRVARVSQVEKDPGSGEFPLISDLYCYSEADVPEDATVCMPSAPALHGLDDEGAGRG